jgi:uncharacterized protein involved in type VI secretion and phage assembly
VSSALFDSVSRIARHEARARALTSIGKVTDIHASDADGDHSVTVLMRGSGLVLPRVPVAVGVMGFAAIPDIGDLVVVLFEEGDFSAPIVVGRLYHADLKPPEHKAGEIVLALPAGETEPKLKFKITSAEPSVLFELPGDVKITAKEETVTIQVGDLKVDIGGGGGGRIEVAAGSSKMVLKKDGDIFISGKNLKIEASSNIDIKAGGQLNISSSGTVTVKGATVNIN